MYYFIAVITQLINKVKTMIFTHASLEDWNLTSFYITSISSGKYCLKNLIFYTINLFSYRCSVPFNSSYLKYLAIKIYIASLKTAFLS